ncbi:MAG TPA: hypothetical protein VGH23_08805 [Rhizomicrobium sp.]|jgi:TPR repeat protein
MNHGEPQTADDARDRLIETARAMVLRGDNKFSIGALCSEAGVDRLQFRAHFSSKTALMAAMMANPAPQPVVAMQPAPVAAMPLLPEPQNPKTEQETSVSTPDAWLERRLRVFERALTALEARAESSHREQSRVIAQLEERLAAMRAEPAALSPDPRPLALEPVAPAPVALAPVMPEIGPQAAPAESVEAAPEAEAATKTPEPAEEVKPASEVLALEPLPVATVSRQEMADVLQSVRDRTRAAHAASAEEEKPRANNGRIRWLAIAGLSLVALFICIGLTLGNTAHATQNDRMAQWQGAGTSHRHAAQGALAQTIASADFGDAKAEARLALAFLRGQGVARDASAALRWSQAAADAGEPVAQYLMGALYQQGEVVKADPERAFAWFATAAGKGNLKAMHNLAIAYAEGLGTKKDEAKAAQWFTAAAERGYVDSAFDLGVMYERGTGVHQDPRQALKWYGIAAQAGDQASKARAEFLKGQMTAADAKRAADAAQAFVRLPALASANTL